MRLNAQDHDLAPAAFTEVLEEKGQRQLMRSGMASRDGLFLQEREVPGWAPKSAASTKRMVSARVSRIRRV